MELTVPFDTNIKNAHKYKEDKHEDLKNHLINIPKINDCNLICLEIGSRGIFSNDNTKRLRELCSKTGAINRKNLRRLKFQLEKIALQASYKMYRNRNNTEWEDPPFVYEHLTFLINNYPISLNCFFTLTFIFFFVCMFFFDCFSSCL